MFLKNTCRFFEKTILSKQKLASFLDKAYILFKFHLNFGRNTTFFVISSSKKSLGKMSIFIRYLTPFLEKILLSEFCLEKSVLLDQFLFLDFLNGDYGLDVAIGGGA